MNIFQILKHKDHQLSTIVYNDRVMMGCLDCGETLIDSKELDYSKDIFKAIPVLLEQEANDFIGEIENFKDKISKFIMNESIDYYKETLQERIIDSIREESDHYRDTLNEQYTMISVYDDVLDIIYTPSVVVDIVETDTFSNYIRDYFINNYLNEIYNNVIEQAIDYGSIGDYKIIKHNEKYTVSYYTYSPGEHCFFAIPIDVIENLNDSNPTPTDILQFESEINFVNYIKNFNYKDEIKYRIEHNLIDVSNLSMHKISSLFEIEKCNIPTYQDLLKILFKK